MALHNPAFGARMTSRIRLARPSQVTEDDAWPMLASVPSRPSQVTEGDAWPMLPAVPSSPTPLAPEDIQPL